MRLALYLANLLQNIIPTKTADAMLRAHFVARLDHKVHSSVNVLLAMERCESVHKENTKPLF
jgi:hypothetical protein